MVTELGFIIEQTLYELKIIGAGFLAILSLVGIVNGISKFIDIITDRFLKRESR